MNPADFVASILGTPQSFTPAPRRPKEPAKAPKPDPAPGFEPAPVNRLQARLNMLRELAPAKLRARLPAWARNAGKFPEPFTPDLRQVLPRGPVTVLGDDSHRAWVFGEKFNGDPENPTQYVSNWDSANHFIAHPVEWIRPTDGNYA